MVLLLFLILFMTEFCGGFPERFPLRLSMDVTKGPMQDVFEKSEPSDNVVNAYGSDYSVSNQNEVRDRNVAPNVPQEDQDKIKYSQFFDPNEDNYLLVKTVKHRNKRYSSYLTLCPFKICNMGRKRTRTRRYLRAIRGDNEES